MEPAGAPGRRILLAMGGSDTTMGGAGMAFPSTSLSLVLHAGADPARRHFEKISRTYWKPIYYFIRRAWSKSDADAKDLTQSFLVHVLEADLLGRFDVNRGNFRAYLKHCLRSFLAVDSRDAGRLKRGGGAALVSLEGASGLELPASTGTPEEDFDVDWTREVVERALADTEAALGSAGKKTWFEAFRRYALDADPEHPPSYRDVASALGISEGDVRNHLRHVRQELRRRVVSAIAEYVVDPADVAAEVSRILGEE